MNWRLVVAAGQEGEVFALFCIVTSVLWFVVG
jgi:hypothetical protein